MRTIDVVRVFGSKQAIADLLQIHRSAVSQWGETVPELRQFQLRDRRPGIDAELAALPKEGATA